MINIYDNSGTPGPNPAYNPEGKKTIRAFRAHLQLLMTAHQSGRRAQFNCLPGWGLWEYSHEVSQLPDYDLASELAHPVCAILDALRTLARQCSVRPASKSPNGAPGLQPDLSESKETQYVLDQVDFALARMFRQLWVLVQSRAATTRNTDLLTDLLLMLCGEGPEIAHLLRRYEKLCPESRSLADATDDEEGFPEAFARDVCERVAVLDQLADEFPGPLRKAAGSMPGWPMLTRGLPEEQERFNELAARLNLGGKL